MKKTTLLLAIITFALCNFAAFLTRSGIFGSLHEFSQSPIGWLFLLLMGMLAVLAVVLIPLRRKSLTADNQISNLSSREACVVIAAIGWLGLTLVVFLGTVAVPLSGMLLAQKLTVRPGVLQPCLDAGWDRAAFNYRGCSCTSLGFACQTCRTKSVVDCPGRGGFGRPDCRGVWHAAAFWPLQ